MLVAFMKRRSKPSTQGRSPYTVGSGSKLQCRSTLASLCHCSEAAADALRRAIAHMTVIGRSSAVERVAWFLIDAASRFGNRSKGALQCTLEMSRRDIADYLGLTIETISRTLTLLKQSDIIQLRTSRLVEIRKPDLLRKLAAADRDDAAIRRLLP